MYRPYFPEIMVSVHKGQLTCTFLSVFQIVINNYRLVNFLKKHVVFLILELAQSGLEKLQTVKFKAGIKNHV